MQRGFSIFSTGRIEDSLDLKNVLTAGSWTKEELDSVVYTHKKPTNMAERLAFYSVQTLRTGFDVVSLYKPKRSFGLFGAFTEKDWVRRVIFLETIAGVPGCVAAVVRHLHSLRLMQRDYGWIHSLLAEAENERMHLLIALNLRQPGVLFRSAVILAQSVFVPFYLSAYVLSPRYCHALVGYLEEEAVYTYTTLLDDIDSGKLPVFAHMRAPRMARVYYNLPATAMVRDVFNNIRADEGCHRDTNHHLSVLKKNDPNTMVDHLRRGHFQNQNAFSGVLESVRKVQEQSLLDQFRRWDTDGSGWLSVEEVRESMENAGEKVTEEELKAIVKSMDTDGDGRISYEEFTRVMHA